MNRGVIISFILFVIHSFADWLDASILGKAGRFFGKVWTKIHTNSFFVNKLSDASEKCTFRDSSVIFKLVKKIAEFIKNIFSKPFAYIKNSAVVSALKWYFDNFFVISISHYGVLLIGAASSYFVIRLIGGGFSAIYALTCALLVISGVLAILINLSVSGIFSGSLFAKIFASFAEIKCSIKNDDISLSKTSLVSFAVLGVLLGFLCYKVGAIFGSAAFVGILCVCAVIYNFKLGVYASLIMFPFAPTMAIVGIILLSLMSFVLKYITDKNFKFVRTPLDVPIVVFMVVLFISTVTSFAVLSSVKIFMVYIVFVAGYFLVTNAIKDFKTLMPVIVLMMIAALGVAGYGIYQHIFGFAEGTTWTDTDMFEDIATRVVSTFDNPNVLGEYLLLLIPLGAALFLGVKNGFAKLGHLAITAALGVCMIYTYSRGNWIGLIVALILFIMFYDTRFVWLGVIALLAAPFVVSQSVITRFTSIGDTKDTSTSYRVYIWMGTFNMLKDYWLCGIGLGTDAFNMIYPHYSYASIVAPHSHNLYLQLLVENGILGLVTFLVMMVAYFRTVISKITKQKRFLQKAVITALTAGVFGYLVQGLFDNVWYNYRVFYMFFAVIGLTMAAVNASKKEEADD